MQFRPQSEQRRRKHGTDLARHHHGEPIGHFDQLPAFPDIRCATVVVRSDDVVRHAELVDQLARPGFVRDEAVWPGFDDTAVDVLGLDEPAELGLTLDDGDWDSCAREEVGGGETRDPSTYDYYGPHYYYLKPLPDGHGS